MTQGLHPLNIWSSQGNEKALEKDLRWYDNLQFSLAYIYVGVTSINNIVVRYATCVVSIKIHPWVVTALFLS